jgi:hypothetical protein
MLGIRASTRRTPASLDPRVRPDCSFSANSDEFVLVEYEYSQTHPEGNVAKYWEWLTVNESLRVTLVHIFDEEARSSGGQRQKTAAYTAAQMEADLKDRFKYVRVIRGAADEAAQWNATERVITERHPHWEDGPVVETIQSLRPSATSETAPGSGQTQPVTPVDLDHGRIRIPPATKPMFPASTGDVRLSLRGNVMTVRYNPRTGPDRNRSGVLSVGKAPMAELVTPYEVLRVDRDGDGYRLT